MGKCKYIVNGKEMNFNFEHFNQKCNEYKQKNQIKTLDALEEIIAGRVSITGNAVHKWRCNQNSPGGIEIIKSLAEIFDVSDYEEFLVECDIEDCSGELSDRQIVAVKRIFDSCVAFLDEFDYSNGFLDYWKEFEAQGVENVEKEMERRIEGMMRKIIVILDQEIFDLRYCDVYNELCEYACDDLRHVYEGKISHGYRDEENSASDDYCDAMFELNRIMSEYIWK